MLNVCARSFSGTLLIALIAALWSAQVAAARAKHVDGACLIGDAAFVPGDVDIFVALVDGSTVRAHFDDHPIGEAIVAMLERGEAMAAWQRMAEAAGRHPVALFDEIAGQSLTVVARRIGDGAYDWAAIAKTPSRGTRALLGQLNPERRLGIAGFEVVGFPEQNLRIAIAADRLIVGPDGAGRLFPEVLERLGGGRVRSPSLLDDADIAETAAQMGSGCMLVLFRHPMPLGGWSLVLGRTDGATIGLHHRGRFDASPFAQKPAPRALDTAPLRAFEAHFLMAMMEPAESRFAGDDILEAVGGATTLSPALRAVRGSRRIVCFGERDSREAGGEGDVLRPTVAVAIESAGEGQDEDELDRHLERLAARFLQLGLEPGMPRRHLIVHEGLHADDRHVDLSPVDAVIADAFPLLERMSLNWSVARGGSGRFWVIATDPKHLRDTVQALEAPLPADAARERELICGRGVFHGPRLAEHVRSWVPDAARLAPDEPGAAEQLAGTLTMISQFAEGVDRGRWRLCRPGALEMILCIELDLVPRRSETGR